MNSISLAALYMGVLATCTPAMGCTQYDVPFAADRCYENVGANIASGCLRIAECAGDKCLSDTGIRPSSFSVDFEYLTGERLSDGPS